MPELPEVETTRRGLAPHLEGRRIASVTLRRPDLRWPIPREISDLLPTSTITTVRRRAKYLLMDTKIGTAIWHLGMSGSMRVLPLDTPVRAHDHVDLVIEGKGRGGQRVLRFNDPRRFGCLLWQAPGETHELLRELGPEPLSDDFDGDYLFERSRGRSVAVKAFLMDQKVVVGVGNIYVAEALFAAGGVADARGGQGVARTLCGHRARGAGDPRLRDPPGRDHAARFHQPRRGARLFRTGTVGLRSRRRALPPLRTGAEAVDAGAAGHHLVRALSKIVTTSQKQTLAPGSGTRAFGV